MANLSDAFGTIKVSKVGVEFLEFLKVVQNEEIAFYKLCENSDCEGVVPNSQGDISFKFSTFGRWSYSNNLSGYLDGDWMGDGENEKAYQKFLAALIAKDGRVDVEYEDSDAAMDWKGAGHAVLAVVDGVPHFVEDFEEE